MTEHLYQGLRKIKQIIASVNKSIVYETFNYKDSVQEIK